MNHLRSRGRFVVAAAVICGVVLVLGCLKPEREIEYVSSLSLMSSRATDQQIDLLLRCVVEEGEIDLMPGHWVVHPGPSTSIQDWKKECEDNPEKECKKVSKLTMRIGDSKQGTDLLRSDNRADIDAVPGAIIELRFDVYYWLWNKKDGRPEPKETSNRNPEPSHCSLRVKPILGSLKGLSGENKGVSFRAGSEVPPGQYQLELLNVAACSGPEVVDAKNNQLVNRVQPERGESRLSPAIFEPINVGGGPLVLKVKCDQGISQDFDWKVSPTPPIVKSPIETPPVVKPPVVKPPIVKHPKPPREKPPIEKTPIVAGPDCMCARGCSIQEGVWVNQGKEEVAATCKGTLQCRVRIGGRTTSELVNRGHPIRIPAGGQVVLEKCESPGL